MAYVKQGPWSSSGILDAGQITAMDDGIYAASLGAGVGANLIGDPHFSDASSQTVLWSPDTGWSFSAAAWRGTNPASVVTSLKYAASLPVVAGQIYHARVEIDLTGNSTTGTISVVLDWLNAAGTVASSSTIATITNGNVPKAIYEGWATVPAGVVSGAFRISLGATVPSTDTVTVSQAELLIVPTPVVVVLTTAAPVPPTLPSGSIIVRI